MKTKNIWVLLILLVAVAGCTREGLMEDKYVTLKYDQTQCSDPWRQTGTDSAVLKSVASYLDSSKLYVADLSIRQVSTGFFCAACTCSTGKVISVTTFDDAAVKAAYQKIGFK